MKRSKEEEEELGWRNQKELPELRLLNSDSDDDFDFAEWLGLCNPALNAFACAAAGATLWHTDIHTQEIALVYTQHDNHVPMAPHATMMVYAHAFHFTAAQLALDSVYDDAFFHHHEVEANLLFAVGWGREGGDKEADGGRDAAASPI